MAFNKNIYDNNYKKENYKQFKVNLKNEEMKVLDEKLDKLNLTKAEFLRQAMKGDNMKMYQIVPKFEHIIGYDNMPLMTEDELINYLNENLNNEDNRDCFIDIEETSGFGYSTFDINKIDDIVADFKIIRK